MNIATMRQAVADAYPRRNWKNKVRQMPDEQILAIYKRFERGGKLVKPEVVTDACDRNINGIREYRTKIDAETVLDCLKSCILRTGVATVSDYDRFSGAPILPGDETRGWISLDSAYLQRDFHRQGWWSIHFPPLLQLTT